MEKTCGICGKKYECETLNLKALEIPIYDGSHIHLSVRSDEGGLSIYNADICNKCADDILCYLISLEDEKRREKTMEKKTKKELLELIKDKETEIKELKVQAERAERYEKYDEAAMEMKALYDSLIGAGFDDDQAFKLVIKMIGSVACNISSFK